MTTGPAKTEVRTRRLLAFDLDGTLLDDDKSIPAHSRRILRRLRERGCLVAVITGRAHVPHDVMDALQPDATAVSNGGTIHVGGRLLAQHLLTPAQVDAILRVAPPDAELTAHTPDALYAPDLGSERFRQWAFGKPLRPIHEVSGKHVQKFNFIHPRAWRYADAARAIPGVTVTGGVAPYEHFLTVTHEHANKGNALREIAAALHVPLARTVAFGDSDNDLAMFEVAGVAVQVGDAACVAHAAHERVSCSALGLPGWLERYAAELAEDLA